MVRIPELRFLAFARVQVNSGCARSQSLASLTVAVPPGIWNPARLMA